jgi:hypothetical protein
MLAYLSFNPLSLDTQCLDISLLHEILSCKDTHPKAESLSLVITQLCPIFEISFNSPYLPNEVNKFVGNNILNTPALYNYKSFLSFRFPL